MTLHRLALLALLGFLLMPGAFALSAAASLPDEAEVQRVLRVPASAAAPLESLGLRPSLALDYGTFLWLQVSEAEYARLAAAGIPHEVQPEPYTLTLGEQRFDPLRGVPAPPRGWGAASGEGAELHLVQMVGPTRAEWLARLRARGLEIVQYLAPYTYVVWGEAEALQGAAGEPFVRWTGAFAPAYRVLPAWRSLPESQHSVRVLLYRGATPDAAVAAIERLGGVLGARAPLNRVWEIASFTLSGGQIQAAARVPGVYSIQPVHTDGGLRGEMSNQVNVNNVDETNAAFPGYLDWLASVGLSGAGVIIANVDGGVQTNHPDLVNRFIPCTGVTCGGNASSDHGTHTAGTMAADGASGVTDARGFLRGLGMAPGASMVEQVYSPFFTQPDGMLLLMRDSHNNGASLSGNSWGPSGSPRGYDDDTLQVDIGTRDTDPATPGDQPLTFVLSFMNGNGGTSSQGTPDEAKNIFTIGSTKMQNTNGSQILSINDLSSNSAHGPALDGRKIPHMVAPGCNVDSSVPGGYGLMCGTSMASPHVSGAVALFIEYFRNLPPAVRGGAADPSTALIKAAFLPVAHDLAGHEDADGNTLGHPFDSKQGWGRMDTEAVVAPQGSVRYFDSPMVFDNTGEEWVQTLSAADPTQPIRLMLVWTDAPGHGLGGTTPAWNNNLDLVVEAGGETFYGNAFGTDGWSVPGGAPDPKNNTEGIFLGPLPPSSITVRVQASDINSDALPNEGDDTDQDFALACYNCALEPAFTLDATPATAAVCAPEEAEYQLTIGSILGYDEPVTLNAQGVPAGATASFAPPVVTPPGSSLLTIGNTNGAAPGTYSIAVIGVAATRTQTTTVELSLATAIPGSVTLVAPANGAPNQPAAPTLEWEATAQGNLYELQVATDPAFASIVYSTTVADTLHTLDTPLEPSTIYYWRVRATNACGDGAWSPVFNFSTLGAPGACGIGSTPNVLYEDDFESGAAGWTHSSAVGADTWALRPNHPHSGSLSWHATDPATTSDQRLVSPEIALPVEQEPLTLQFWNAQSIESDGSGGCYDGAILEISTNDGASWERIAEDRLLTDPYDGSLTVGNPLGSGNAWCGDPDPYLQSVVDVTDYAGETVRFRFRLGSDNAFGQPGWFIDDVSLQSCETGAITPTPSATATLTATPTATATATATVTTTATATATLTRTVTATATTTATPSATPTATASRTASPTVTRTTTATATPAMATATATVTATATATATVDPTIRDTVLFLPLIAR